MVAQERQRFDEAEEWLKKGLEIWNLIFIFTASLKAYAYIEFEHAVQASPEKI